MNRKTKKVEAQLKYVSIFKMDIINVHFFFSHWGVSSVPFYFEFPFELHCELVSSGISSQSAQNILKWRVT